MLGETGKALSKKQENYIDRLIKKADSKDLPSAD